MEVGAEVWYKDKSDGWCPAVIIKRDESAGQIKFTVEATKGRTKEEYVVAINRDTEPEVLKLKNTSEDSEVENLINLPFLHEPAILHCLELRYNRSQIYTYTGPILIAMNPFKKVDLYSDKLLDSYYKSGLKKKSGVLEDTRSPHIFAIADDAYQFMMTGIESDFGGNSVSDQSILISGESGAGKTESTKIVLRYLTTVASDAKEIKMDGSIMDKILKSNPILEALGNAKTIRNDNSSRFGKFIELKFSEKGHLIGGFIRTYLLEKVRLTSQQLNERNFHIFYQMGVGGSFTEKEKWGLKSLRDFHYVNQGQCFGIERINDEVDYADLRGALKTLRFDEDDVHSMLEIVAGLMHLGQLKFDAVHGIGEDSSELSKDATVSASLSVAMKLLGIAHNDFLRTVTERTIIARDDKYQKKLTDAQASDARDSISRTVYGKLFDWVVATINKEIQTISSLSARSEIAVLDIFGFECLTENSFEQLCINYTNETLQQQFNQFIFKLEQAEYEAEGIEWSFVSFPDNQDCIDLIESKKKSIFRLLDDECMTAAGSDTKFAGRMITELGEYTRLSVSDKQKVNHKFCINHYAGEVVYSTKTFTEKNKDELPKESIDLMAASSVPLLKLIFTTNYAPPTTDEVVQKGSSLSSPTICTQFKGQLASLMSKIESTKPHYIRCLKPNDQNKPDLLNRLRTTEQLRYGGVLEAVRVARSGFPVRFSHEEFYARYRPIANPFSAATRLPRFAKGSSSEQAKLCTLLLEFIRDDSLPKLTGKEKDFIKLSRKLKEVSVMYTGANTNNMDLSTSIQLGKTKVFFRKPAHDLFESRKSKQAILMAKRIQTQVRRWLARLRYLRALKAVRRLQIAIRYFLFHRRFIKKRRNNAATRIQTAFRCFISTKHFKKISSAILSCQTLYRGKIARRVSSKLIIERAAYMAELASDEKRQAAFAAEKAALEARLQREKEEREAEEARLLKEQQEQAELEARLRKEEAEKAERVEIARLQKEKEEREAEEARLLREQREQAELEARLRKEEEDKAERARIQREKEEMELALKVAEETRLQDLEKARQQEAEKLRALEVSMKLKEEEAAATVAEANLELTTLKESVEHLAKEKQNHEVRAEALYTEKTFLSTKVLEQSETLAQLETKLSSLEIDLQEERQKVEQEKALVVTLKEEFAKREIQIRDMEAAAVSEREAAVSKEMMATLENERAVMEKRVKDLEVNFDSKCQAFEAVHSQLDAKNEEVSALRKSLESSDSQMLALQVSLAETSEKLMAAEQVLGELAAVKSTAAAQVDDLTAALNAKSVDLSELSLRLEEKICELDSVKTFNLTMESKMEALETGYVQSNSTIEKLQSLVTKAQLESNEANVKITELESEKLKLYDDLESLQKQLGSRDIEFRDLSSASLERESQIDVFKTRLDELCFKLEQKEILLRHATEVSTNMTELLNSLQIEKSEINDKVQELTEALEKKSLQVSEILVQSEEKESALHSLNEAYAFSESKIQTLETESIELSSKLSSVESLLDITRKDAILAEEKCLRLEAERLELVAEIEALRKSLNASSSQHGSRDLADAEMDLQTNKSERALQETIILCDLLKSEKVDLESKLVAMEEIANSKVRRLEIENAEAKDAMTDIQTLLELSRQEAAISSAKIFELQAQLDEKESETARIKELMERINDLELALSMKSEETSRDTTTTNGDECPSSPTEEHLLSKLGPEEVLQILQELSAQKEEAESKNAEKDEAIQALHDMVRNLEASCCEQDIKIKELQSSHSPAENKDAMAMNSALTKELIFKSNEIEELSSLLEQTRYNYEQVKADKEKLRSVCIDLDSRLKELDVQNKRKDDTLSSTVRYLHKQTFNSRSEDFKTRMAEGLCVKVYSIAASATDCLLSISRNPLQLSFAPINPAVHGSRYSFFGSPSPNNATASSSSSESLPSISIMDIHDVESGLSRESSLVFTTLNEPTLKDSVLTITYNPSMVLVVVFENSEARNSVLNGLKILIAEKQLEMENLVTVVTAPTQQEDAPVDINEKYSRLMAQVLSLTNDVMEREEELIVLRNRARAHQNEDMIRAELSRRLAEVLEQKESLAETLKEQDEE